MLADLLAAHGDEIADGVGLSRRLLDELGVIPSYYLHYFYAHDAVLAEQLDGVPRATTVAEIERELLEMYRDPNLVEKPALLEKRGGAFYSEAAIGLVGVARAGDTGEAHVVDVRNNGTIAGLADDDVSRCRREVDASGANPLPQAPVAPELLGLMQHVTAYERLAAQAAVSGDPALARKALLTHPLIGQHPLSRRTRRPAARSRRRTPAAIPRGDQMSSAAVLAVDGGNSKTDLALVNADGCARARSRAVELASSPRRRGLPAVLEGLIARGAWKRGSLTTAAGSRRSPRS